VGRVPGADHKVFGPECRTKAESRLERDEVFTKKMLANGRQVEDTGGPTFHPIKIKKKFKTNCKEGDY